MEKTIRPRVERIERVWTPDSKLHILHRGKEAVFAYPSIGPDTYTAVGKKILEQGMKVPTGDYMASLLHSAYCNVSAASEPEFQNVRNIMKDNFLWVFNKDLWASEGVYTVPDLRAIGRSRPLSQNELEKMLKGGKEIKGIRFSKDKKVRFAPKETYKLGDHTSESLSKDGFVIANYDFEGAEKLGEVSTKFKHNPRTYGVNVEEGQSPELRVSALYDGRGINGSRLDVDGFNFGDYWDGHAFGVLK